MWNPNGLVFASYSARPSSPTASEKPDVSERGRHLVAREVARIETDAPVGHAVGAPGGRVLGEFALRRVPVGSRLQLGVEVVGDRARLLEVALGGLHGGALHPDQDVIDPDVVDPTARGARRGGRLPFRTATGGEHEPGEEEEEEAGGAHAGTLPNATRTAPSVAERSRNSTLLPSARSPIRRRAHRRHDHPGPRAGALRHARRVRAARAPARGISPGRRGRREPRRDAEDARGPRVAPAARRAAGPRAGAERGEEPRARAPRRRLGGLHRRRRATAARLAGAGPRGRRRAPRGGGHRRERPSALRGRAGRLGPARRPQGPELRVGRAGGGRLGRPDRGGGPVGRDPGGPLRGRAPVRPFHRPGRQRAVPDGRGDRAPAAAPARGRPGVVREARPSSSTSSRRRRSRSRRCCGARTGTAGVAGVWARPDSPGPACASAACPRRSSPTCSRAGATWSRARRRDDEETALRAAWRIAYLAGHVDEIRRERGLRARAREARDAAPSRAPRPPRAAGGVGARAARRRRREVGAAVADAPR